jgi:hypothetical protein
MLHERGSNNLSLLIKLQLTHPNLGNTKNDYVKLITLLVEFKQMKLAILTTAVFNNLLFHKAKLSTMISYDLDILKESPCLSKCRYSVR